MSMHDDEVSVEISFQHSRSIAAADEQVVDLEQLPEEEYNNDDGTILPEDGTVASSSSSSNHKKKYAVAALALVAVTAVALGMGYGTSTSSNEKTTSAAQAGNFGPLGGSTSSKSSKSSTKSSYSGSAKSNKSKSSKRGSNDLVDQMARVIAVPGGEGRRRLQDENYLVPGDSVEALAQATNEAIEDCVDEAGVNATGEVSNTEVLLDPLNNNTVIYVQEVDLVNGTGTEELNVTSCMDINDCIEENFLAEQPTVTCTDCALNGATIELWQLDCGNLLGCPCYPEADGGESWKNHGKYVNCIVQAVKKMRNDDPDSLGDLNQGDIVSYHAQLDCGKKSKDELDIPECCLEDTIPGDCDCPDDIED